ncbi:hypothetical protein BDA96_07G008700 [Sorghum bicolor]|uniref:Pectinesterase inhibitor domain-containing protein n=2 Tax=Sorghum bicolor TaxID=4558 RepID=A0A1B6PES9_SORBI|nr:pectinesterase inhibitor 28 [Sorghum bicolor]KAG0522109.1 hypothetical protein BDA96_07G008700 [Sorghum bicolor]KXG24201.1 hypothetical protein SORBI_3007G008200 [Sorghum bicolor]OQU79766.1 hypothetical protein SORBI_3007G008200 [Sorghum bicolor]|eukprot:XP_002444885.2 pectinesterase inhibitor 28 [Sorghum bicolor]
MAMVVLLLLSLLPLSTLGSRSGPTPAVPHHGHAGHGTPKHSSPPPQPTTAELVRSTCNSTAYYDLCVSALGADPSSATADVRGLSTIAVSAAAANASGGAATATALANGNGTATSSNAQAAAPAATAATALLRTCAAKYGQARDALAAAGDSIAQQDYDFASVHVSAAAEYPQVCKALFRRQKPAGGQYPTELAAREEALRQLCSVALDIIALASNTSS